MARRGLGMNVSGVGGAIRQIERVRDGWIGDTRYIVGVGANYGAYVEFGTSSNRAQPYLFPAVREVMRSDFERIEREAGRTSDPQGEIVRRLALAITAEARRRAPVDTSFLENSIQPFPASGSHPGPSGDGWEDA